MRKNGLYIVILVVLLLASFNRLWNLESNPAWYTDEGTHIEIARHLINGENHYLGITDSYLIAARLPLYEHLLALWFRLVGVDMLMLRILTSFMGILTTALVYRVTKTASGNITFALVSLALFAVYPQAVIYSRFGFSYNLLPILILSGLWCLIRFKQTTQMKYLVIASLLFGFGTLSDFIAWSFLPAVIVIVLFIRPKHALIAVICLVTPFTLYALSELSIHPAIFLHDLTYTLARTGNSPLSTQIVTLLKNLQVILTETWWILAGIIGLVFVRPCYFRRILIVIIILPILISGRTVALYNLSAYYLIPFLPFVTIGISALLTFSVSNLLERFYMKAAWHQRFIFGVASLIVILVSANLIGRINHRLTIGIEHFLVDAEEARKIETVLIDYAEQDDVIITSPTLAWMFPAQVTDYQLASLAQGQDGVHFPANLYPHRFAFDVKLSKVDYAIVDTLWRDWGAVHMPAVADMLTEIQKWDLIHQTETIQIYRNPKT